MNDQLANVEQETLIAPYLLVPGKESDLLRHNFVSTLIKLKTIRKKQILANVSEKLHWGSNSFVM